jgi:hypothetical protein
MGMGSADLKRSGCNVQGTGACALDRFPFSLGRNFPAFFFRLASWVQPL